MQRRLSRFLATKAKRGQGKILDKLRDPPFKSGVVSLGTALVCMAARTRQQAGEECAESLDAIDEAEVLSMWCELLTKDRRGINHPKAACRLDALRCMESIRMPRALANTLCSSQTLLTTVR